MSAADGAGGRVDVVYVVTRLAVGGPARRLQVLATRMGPGFNSVLLHGALEAGEGSLAEEIGEAGAVVVQVPGLRRRISPVADLRALWWLYRFLRQTRPLIVSTHTAKAGALGRVAALAAGVPVRIHTYHGHVLVGYFGPVVSTVFRWIERALAALSTWVIAVSPEVAADLTRMGIGRDRVTVVSPGFDLEGLAGGSGAAVRRELGVPDGAPLVGIVGRLAPIKNHDLFLRAALRVLDRLPDARFLVVGDGGRAPELRDLAARLGLADRVTFGGWRSDLADVYAAMDVVVCTSINEGLPAALVEAGAAGRPVVSTRVGGVPDLVEDGVNGLLVPSGETEALADAIVTVLTDASLAARLGREGRRIALGRYGAERLVEETERLYHRLLEPVALTRMHV
ncbi:MAG TPA: glycosyltransferase family 4 protein [Candidatus Dormibacteraeota bacterium]